MILHAQKMLAPQMFEGPTAIWHLGIPCHTWTECMTTYAGLACHLADSVSEAHQNVTGMYRKQQHSPQIYTLTCPVQLAMCVQGLPVTGFSSGAMAMVSLP
jgi:hypothetical protein